MVYLQFQVRTPDYAETAREYGPEIADDECALTFDNFSDAYAYATQSGEYVVVEETIWELGLRLGRVDRRIIPIAHT